MSVTPADRAPSPARGSAVVTGGGSGIGRAVALALAARGQAVVVAGRRSGPLEETVGLIKDQGGSASAALLDVTDGDATDRLISSVAASGRLSVVVANAGNFTRSTVADAEPAAWIAQVEVNLTGTFHTVRAAVRAMRDQDVVDGSRGHLFTVNSGAGVRGFPEGSAYAAAKHGVRGLTESLRPEVEGLGIKVTDLVVSATVESEMSAHRQASKIGADVVGTTVVACLGLPGAANWDRVDLGQLRG